MFNVMSGSCLKSCNGRFRSCHALLLISCFGWAAGEWIVAHSSYEFGVFVFAYAFVSLLKPLGSVRCFWLLAEWITETQKTGRYNFTSFWSCMSCAAMHQSGMNLRTLSMHADDVCSIHCDNICFKVLVSVVLLIRSRIRFVHLLHPACSVFARLN